MKTTFTAFAIMGTSLAQAQNMCPVAAGTATGTVSLGEASTHPSGNCAGHSWGHCDQTFDSPACDPENIYASDEAFVGISYRQQSSMPQWDGVYVSSCLEVGFGDTIVADGIHIVGAGTDETVCGVRCSGQYCGTSAAVQVFTSDADTDEMPSYTTFTHAGTVRMDVEGGGGTGNGEHHDTYDDVLEFGSRTVKWAAFCRSGAGGARDHILLDFVQLRAGEGQECGGGAACQGDLDADSEVSVTDLLILLGVFGSNAEGDLNGDGETSVADLLILLGAFGNTCGGGTVDEPPMDGLLSFLVADRTYIDMHANDMVMQWLDVRGSEYPTYMAACGDKRPAFTDEGVDFSGGDKVMISTHVLDLFSTPGATIVVRFVPESSTGNQQFIVNYGNGYEGTNNNLEMGVDAGTRGATGRFGIHGGSSQATLTAAATVNIGASNTFMTVIGADDSVSFEHMEENGDRAQRDSNGVDSNPWQGANYASGAPIDIGCRIDGNWVQNTVQAHRADCGTTDSCYSGTIQALLIYDRALNDDERNQVQQYLQGL